MAYELILSTDTLDMGRIKLNNFFNNSATGLWTGSTGTGSIISLDFATYAAGNYSFSQGYKTSGLTGNYSFMAGGKNNYSRGSFNFIGPGLNNKVKTNGSNYSFIGTGRLNYTAVGALTLYSSIVNGKNNQINRGKYSSIFNGNGGRTKYALSTIINGISNQAYGYTSTIINGALNQINIPLNYSKRCNTILNGYYNRIYGGSNGNDNIIFNGTYNYIINSSRCVVFGAGNVCSTKLGQFIFGNNMTTPNNYEMALGQAGRRVRIRFGSGVGQVGGYLATAAGGSWQNSNADYAEYFEWKDKNINNENRAGFFVEINDGKIQIAKTENVIGVVSRNPSFLADSHQDYWQNVYLKDEWGVPYPIYYEKYEVESKEPNDKKDKKIEIFFDENDKTFLTYPYADNTSGVTTQGTYNKSEGIFINKVEDCKLNPNYDSNIKYVSRKERSEWEVIGLIGKLRVRTSEQILGNMIDVDINTGMAKNGTKYHVLEKIKDYDGNYGIVLIFFK